MNATTANASSVVTEVPPAPAPEAYTHFSACLRFETDCWDVNHALTHGPADFVLFDTRSPEAYAEGHIEGAFNVPRRQITAQYLEQWPADTLFVVHCAGPHCNGAHRAAMRLSSLGRQVKIMIGGMTGWIDEGLPLVAGGTAS